MSTTALASSSSSKNPNFTCIEIRDPDPETPNLDTDSNSKKKNFKQILQDGEEAICYGYRKQKFKTIIYIILNLITAGTIHQIARLCPRLNIKLRYVRCCMDEAETVLIKDTNDKFSICHVKKQFLNIENNNGASENRNTEPKPETPPPQPCTSGITADTSVEFGPLGNLRQESVTLPTVASTSSVSSDTSELVSSDHELLEKSSSDDDSNGKVSFSNSSPEPPLPPGVLINNKATYIKYFEYHAERFVLNEMTGLFFTLSGLTNLACKDFFEQYKGLTRKQQKQMRRVFGPNIINVEVKNYFRLLIDEVLNGFYIFQAFSVGVWFFDDYFLYAMCIVIISVISIGMTLRETREQMLSLKRMADGKVDETVIIQRPNGNAVEIRAGKLVPGDILLIPSGGCIMPCDAVLTHGTCIVDESMLTGESVPVHKSAIMSSDERYDAELFKRNTLFSGTRVIQTRFYAGNKASCVVTRTGFTTNKGSLVRSIMFPKEISFGFYRDATRFVGIMFGFASIAMAYTIYTFYQRNASLRVLIVRVLDTLTIAVPPALPAAMTVGSYNAQRRLKSQQIYCISPDRINYAGKINLLAFDKTGTLTEDGLEMWCVVPFNRETNRFEEPVPAPTQLPHDSFLLQGMASCHSLTYINGEVVGDPLDFKMFQSTGWELEEPEKYQEDTQRFDELIPMVVKKDGTEIGMIREFEFTPQLQRMSVVASILDEFGTKKVALFCKGSPEKVLPLCKIVPEGYESILDKYTSKGYRVVVMCWKIIDSGQPWHHLQRMPRADMECDLTFAGFIVMQNTLKSATKPVIKELINGGIKCVMVTGDNMLTALSVARECHMIQENEQAVVVELNEHECLEFKLKSHHTKTEVSITIESPVSPLLNCDQDQTDLMQGGNLNIQMGYDDEEESPMDQSSFEAIDTSGTSNAMDASDELEQVIIYQSGPSLKRVAGSYTKLRRNGSEISSLAGHGATDDATFIDMNNHLVTVSSTAAMLPSNSNTITDGTIGASILHKLTSPQFLTGKYFFVVSGKVWDWLYNHCPKEELHKIIVKGVVFARMSPENKRQLIESFQEIGYCVGMCGDGANDCAALKMAHVGISLSEAEASVAAPFTSKIADISCVRKVVLEGRCAMVTSFSMFKFMTVYSFIQLISVLILYTVYTNLADQHFLFIDLGIITTLAVTMGRTHPYDRIVNKQPMANLLSIQNFTSLISQLSIAAACQLAALFYLKSQSWYEPVHLNNADDKVLLCWETTTIFPVSSFQYLVISLAFSKGYPFRKAFYTNYWLVSLYAILSGTILLFMVFPFPGFSSFFNLMPLVFDETYVFRLALLIIPLANIVASLSSEYLISNTGFLKKLLRKFGYKESKEMYAEILDDVNHDSSWPEIKLA